MTRAGRLRHLVEIQSVTRTRGPDGTPIEAWATVECVDADIVQMRGKELETAREIDARVDSKITIRAVESLLPSQRMISEGVIYNLVDVDNVRLLNHEMQIMAISEPEGATRG